MRSIKKIFEDIEGYLNRKKLLKSEKVKNAEVHYAQLKLLVENNAASEKIVSKIDEGINLFNEKDLLESLFTNNKTYVDYLVEVKNVYRCKDENDKNERLVILETLLNGNPHILEEWLSKGISPVLSEIYSVRD